MDFTPHETGCFIRLLCHQWNRGSVPAEPERMKNIAGGDVSEHVIAKFNKCAGGILRNERLEDVRAKQAHFRAEQSRKGKLSGESRREKSATTREPRFNPGSTTAQTTDQPSVEPKGNSPSPSPYPTKTYSTKELLPEKKELADRAEKALGDQWVNDAGKWVNRIKENGNKSFRVISEVENAIKENRIKTTPAQYAEQTWKEFQ